MSWYFIRFFVRNRLILILLRVVLSVVMAATSMSTLAPQLQSLTNATSAANELFVIIDQPSLLDPLDEAGQQPSVCNGQIEVRNINFSYPSRPIVKIFDNLSLSILVGKTTALIECQWLWQVDLGRTH